MTAQESLFNRVQDLEASLDGARAEIARSTERLKFFEDENSHLHEMLRDFKRQRFGSKSERYESPDQMCFNEAEVLAKQPKPDGEDDSEEIEVKAHTKKRGKRKRLPENLPREVVVIELAEDQRMGEDGKPLKPIGFEVSEKLVFEPAVMKVVEYHRIRYGADSGDTGIIAQPLPSIIPKGIVTAGLLAHIVMQKFGYGMPFYRQEDMFKRMGVEIPRCTQARWVIQAAEACLAIKNVLQDRLMLEPYVSCDETWTQVLKEKGRTAESKSWMWVRATPAAAQKIVLFDYDPHRSGAVAEKLFAEYQGFLQVDGYGAYNCLEKQKGILRIGCNMHGRRKFEAAYKIGAKQGKSLGEEALKYYKRLYDIETEAREFSHADRHVHRQTKAVPIWKEFKEWAIVTSRKVPPKSKIGQAFHYFLGEYDYLIGYLKDGMLEMDNGFAERAITNFAVGRKNWLFSDSESGADASSFFYSIVVTAKINGCDPYQVLKKIFEQIPLAKTIEDVERIADIIVTRPTLS